MPTRLTDKLKKLPAMTAPEIAGRLRERTRVAFDRFRFRFHFSPKALPPNAEQDLLALLADSGEPFATATGALSFKHYLAQGPAQRFYFSPDPEARSHLRAWVESHFPQWKQKAIEDAERLCRHQVELLGYPEVQLGSEIDWHRDPLTGKCWERRFWADYDLVQDASAGDPKTIHELNRHQHLPRLAKAYFLTGEERYAAEAVAQLTGWIAQNPPGLGIHWHSSLEISLRVLSWLWTLFLLLPSRALDETAARRIGASLFRQLTHVSRYLSLYSSPNTHLLAEASALFIAGVLFPGIPPASNWRERGRDLLIRELHRQVSDEGIHAELSSYYHCYALDFYLQVLVLSSRNRVSWTSRAWDKFERMLVFLLHLTRPDGTIPLLGDDDGGRALALARTHYGSFQDALCAGAVLFRRPDFKYQAGEFSEETFWLLGEDAGEAFASLKSVPQPERSAVYPRAGYFIHRSGWGDSATAGKPTAGKPTAEKPTAEKPSHLVFDCGGMGMLRGGHSHADALSLSLFGAGRELLVDPGAGCYNAAPQWRDFFRSTRAHNTAIVDGQDQSEPGGTFGWKRSAQARLLRQFMLSEMEYVEAEHGGYSQPPAGVLHRRRLLYGRPGYWVVVDDFQGTGEHRVDWFYHFPPEATVSFLSGNDGGRELQVLMRLPGGGGLKLFFCASAPFTAEVLCGRTDPIQGWVSRRYGERQPAPVLCVSAHCRLPAALISVLAPFGAGQGEHAGELAEESLEGRRLEVDEGPGLACVLQHSEGLDVVAFSTESLPLQVADFEMRGEFFWLRNVRGVLRRVFAVNVSCLRHEGRVVFQRTTPASPLWLRLGEPEELSESVKQASAWQD